MECADKIMGLDRPVAFISYIIKGKALIGLCKYNEAIEYAEKLIEEEDHIDGYAIKRDALKGLCQYDEADKVNSKYLELLNSF